MLALIVLSSITKKGEIVRNMAPLGHCLWFWWLYDNIINETNKFVKWIILGPKDEYKALAKQESKKELKEMMNWLKIHMK